MPSTHDHELNIDGEVEGFDLMRDEEKRAMYQVIEEIPRYRDPLRFTQTNWIDGHGQHDMRNPEAYFEGQSIDTTQEGRVFLGPLLQEQKDDQGTPASIPAPVVYCWFPAAASGAGALFCATATHLYRLDAEGWDITGTDLSGVVDLKVFGATLFAARGHGTAYSYSTDGDAFTAAGTSDDKAVKFLVAPNSAGTAEVLWKFDTPNEVKNNTDGTGSTTQWSSAWYIGDTANDITNMFLSNNNFMTGKTDGLWHLDSDGGTHQLRPDLKHNRSTDNFKYVTEWQAGIYHSEIDGMGEITSYNAYEPMGPTHGLEDIGKSGAIVGLAADKDWIYVAVKSKEATPLYTIYKGREVRKGGELRWQWCPFIYLGSDATATLAVIQHSATDRRLWFGKGAASYYVILSDNPTADSAYKYTTSGFLRMSYDYGTDSEWDKLWQSAVIEQHRVNSGVKTAADTGETIAVKYRDDTDLAVIATAIVAAYNTAGVVETNFTSALNNKRVSFQLYLASDTNTATPVVTSFQAKGVEKPVTTRIHEATYTIGDEPSNRAKTLRALFRTVRDSTTLVKFADLRYGDKTAGTSSGDYVWTVMEPGYPKEVEVLHTKGRAPELGIMVRLREVSFTIS